MSVVEKANRAKIKAKLINQLLQAQPLSHTTSTHSLRDRYISTDIICPQPDLFLWCVTQVVLSLLISYASIHHTSKYLLPLPSCMLPITTALPSCTLAKRPCTRCTVQLLNGCTCDCICDCVCGTSDYACLAQLALNPQQNSDRVLR